MTINRRKYLTIAAIPLILALSSCITTKENRGYVTEFSRFDQIETWVTDKEGVLKTLGSPSSRTTFGDEQWFYIGMSLKKGTFVNPEVINQDVVAITFNEDGIVKAIDRKSMKDRRKIAISEDATPTEGNQITILEQLLGNLGRFNPKQK